MIVVPALHPAREFTALVDAVRPGEVHRAVTTIESIGGKAINVARFVAQMNGPLRLVVLGDEAVQQLIDDDDVLAGVRPGVEVIHTPRPSRIDLVLVDGRGTPTVVNGSAEHTGDPAVAAVVDRSLEELGPGDILVLAGSLPAGASGALARLIAGAQRVGASVILDASGPWLVEGLAAGPRVVKINEAEAHALGEAAMDGRATAGTGSPRPGGLAGPEILAVTAGASGIRAWIGDNAWRVAPPPGVPVVNTLGAGDAVTAGLALGLQAGRSPIDAIILGAAMAAARLPHLETRLEPATVPALERSIRAEPTA